MCSQDVKHILFEKLFQDVIKVDREDHFQRPGFLHIIICVDVLKISKFEGFDREPRRRPF